MKQIIKNTILFLTFLISLTSFAQDKETIWWIPDAYTKVIIDKASSDKEVFLKPIEAIMSKNGKYSIQTYRGMLQPVLGKKNLSGKLGVKNISLNLNYFTSEEQDSINKYKYFIVPYKDSLVLEIYGGKTINYVKYIKEVRGYKFDEPRIAFSKMLFEGEYDIYDSENFKIDSHVRFFLDGRIQGSAIWNFYKLNKVYVSDEYNHLYDLFEFHSINSNQILNFALFYNKEDMSWKVYEYSIMKDNYRINISAKIIFTFKRSSVPD